MYNKLTVSGVELHPQLLLLLLVPQEDVVGAARDRGGGRRVHQVHVVLKGKDFNFTFANRGNLE